MNLKNLHQSKTVRGIIIGLGVAVIVLVIFNLGLMAGYNKARFFDRLGNNFDRNFMGPSGQGFNRALPGRPMSPAGHGAVGKIVSLALPLIVVAGPDNLEQTVVIKGDTLLRKFREEVKPESLQVGDSLVILGIPNEDGQVEAKLIRIVPSVSGRSAGNQSSR